jgi:light-regulated signal transduction histidine kinase (bacteriophytochrome)
LIDDLLIFSRMGRAELNLAPVALADLVAEIREELEPTIRQRAIEWKIGALPRVRGDRALLRLALANLLGNAVKFTRGREPAIIEIAAQPAVAADGTVTFFVRDNGAGYNPKYTEKLFGVFQRLHNQRDFEGTGIGLANVKRIVTRHGGRVWAEGAVGRGATFFFTLAAAET